MNNIEDKIKKFKDEYYNGSYFEDNYLLTAMAIKYYYYEHDFSKDKTFDFIVDGANDGGIDAVFNDPNSENNDVVIIQAKNYQNAILKPGDIVTDLNKIDTTLKDFYKGEKESYNKLVKKALEKALDEKDEDGVIKVLYVTSYKVKDSAEKKKFQKKVEAMNLNFQVELIFCRDFLDHISLVESGNKSVPSDKIEIDKVDNYLQYEDSIIVNMSSKSLIRLYELYYSRGLLAQNLRYYVKSKKVDDAIKNTIKKDYQNFWYMNNGIIFLTKDYEINSKYITLKDFSIINGGQTTALIGNMKDQLNGLEFYIPTKIVLDKEKYAEDSSFASKVAQATNSQKAIQPKDLIANQKEQIELKADLTKYKIFYELKRGEQKPIKYKSFIHVKTDQITKLIASSLLQMPGTARSSTSKLYNNNDLYYKIYPNTSRARYISDLIKIENYYNVFKKSEYAKKYFTSDTSLGLISNGFNFSISLLTYFIGIHLKLYKHEEVIKLDNLEDFKSFMYNKLKHCKQLLSDNYEYEEKAFISIFTSIIVIMETRYDVYAALKKSKNEPVSPSNYTKLDSNYHNLIVDMKYGQRDTIDIFDNLSKLIKLDNPNTSSN